MYNKISQLDFDTKVEKISGVGPKFAARLHKLGIKTISNLLFNFPRRYLDFTSPVTIASLNSADIGNFVVLKGKIATIENKRTSRRRFTVTEAYLEDESGSLKVVWFNQPFLLKMLTVGRELIIYGKLVHNVFSNELTIESPERSLYPKISPIYSETVGISSRYINSLISNHKFIISDIIEHVPAAILSKYNLLNICEAIFNIHFPKNNLILKEAQRRLAFDELFLISLKSQVSKEEAKKTNAPVLKCSKKEIEDFIATLSFELTSDQKKATKDILNDLGKEIPMSRLLNGDVGSGKTVVAAIAAYIAVLAGYRVVIMAPTSILAQQHFKTFCGLFKDKKISVGLFTANSKDTFQIQKTKNKELANNSQLLSADIIIGTQALIQKDVKIKNLGLVVVDEQHRFGVKQRSVLLELRTNNCERMATQEIKPHFLSMTATPIPRTLHLALFGDLDISIIKEKPANRKEIKTRFVEPHNREKAYEFIRAHIKAGRQVFVVCPLIEEGQGSGAESLELFEEERKSVKAEYEKLLKIFPEYRIEMLHGKMKPKEKDTVMNEFSNNKVSLLVSTSVVEVGVDVPNATIMVVEDAERFGLAQIHQFRGRVGRADYQSFCFLFSSTMSEKATTRLKALESTSDGFKLAEIDLEQRGPGAIFGTEQSGMLDLKMASFSDRELIEEASAAAKLIIESDPGLTKHPLLKEKISEYLQNRHLE